MASSQIPQLMFNNAELLDIIKKHLGRVGNYQLVVNFAVGATTVLNEKRQRVPMAFGQVVGVGIELAPEPGNEKVSRAPQWIPAPPTAPQAPVTV